MQHLCMPDSSDFAPELISLASRMAKREVTQQAIAAATGIHQSQISRILAGKSKRKSSNVERLCRYARENHPEQASFPHRDLVEEEASQLLADLIRRMQLSPRELESLVAGLRRLATAP